MKINFASGGLSLQRKRNTKETIETLRLPPIDFMQSGIVLRKRRACRTDCGLGTTSQEDTQAERISSIGIVYDIDDVRNTNIYCIICDVCISSYRHNYKTYNSYNIRAYTKNFATISVVSIFIK